MGSGDDGLQKKLLQAFNMEAEERLQALGTQLIALEEKVRAGVGGTDDSASRRLVDDIHRELHSLKGASRAVNYLDIEQVCQDAESVLSAVKRGDIRLTAPFFDILHAVVALVEHLTRTAGGGRDSDADRRVAMLRTALKALEQGEEPLLEPPAQAVSDDSAADAGQAAQTQGAPPGKDSPGRTGASMRETDANDAGLVTPSQQESEHRASDWQAVSGTIRLATEDMSAMRAMAEDIQATRASLSRKMRELRDVVESVQLLEGMWTEAMYEGASGSLNASAGADSARSVQAVVPSYGAGTAKPAEATLAVPGEAMNNFLDACRNDFSTISGRLSLLWHALELDRRELDKEVAALSEAMKQALLMPLDALVGHFPRVVRDLARGQGKDAVCEIEGGEIAVDRRILEMLNDPLMHALRNALDHGIESPAERTAAGKSGHGVVRIRIERQGAGQVRIEISDDGRGIDVDELRNTAVNAGILDAERAGELSREEMLSLVFVSDLTTAREVSTMSGRGLGMAIVRGKVEQAGGHVGISSARGKGTVLTIVVPVTLTSFDGVVVSAAGRLFVAPMDSMVRLVRADTSMMRESGGRKLLSDGGAVLPLATLAEVLSIPERERDASEVRNVLVARGGDDLAAIVVDEVLEEQEVMLKYLGPQLRRVRHIAGVTMLGTGELAPVLQMSDVVAAVARPGARLARPAAPAPAERRTPRILVVEDSITSRMLIKNVLEAAGYEVLTAVDGMEGFAILGSTPLDLVVSDVEMPRLDGFGLTEKIRADARISDMPVILVTSLDSREHRERGLNVGANAYIVKSKFDQSNLLDVIHSLL